MVTNSEIIPTKEEINNAYSDVADDNVFLKRFTDTEHGEAYLAVIILIFMFLILKNTVLSLVISVLKAIFDAFHRAILKPLWDCTGLGKAKIFQTKPIDE